MKSRTFIVSKGEVHIPSCLCGEGEEEAMPAGRFIFIHCTYGFNDLRQCWRGSEEQKDENCCFCLTPEKNIYSSLTQNTAVLS